MGHGTTHFALEMKGQVVSNTSQNFPHHKSIAVRNRRQPPPTRIEIETTESPRFSCHLPQLTNLCRVVCQNEKP